MMKKMNAFTLAEVLITLGIIGVVAAMTMPTLINQTNGAQYKAAYKKALSAISQGVTLNVALDDLSFAEVDNTNTKLYDHILKPRMNIVNAIVNGNFADYSIKNTGNNVTNGTQNTTLFFNDGSMFQYNAANAKNCTKDSSINSSTVGDDGSSTQYKNCSGFIDVNGLKGPNKIVTCDTNTGKANNKSCTVTNPTDIYPVVIFDQTVVPSTEAAKAVLYGKS